MGIRTGIAWTTSTFNPWIGCTKVGQGCDFCYAEAAEKRFAIGGTTHWGHGVPRHRTAPSTWRNPLKWNRKAEKRAAPWRVFCASFADVFDNEVPQEWRDDLWQLIRSTPHLTWQIVTKRVPNIAKMLPPDWGTGYPNVWLIATICNQDEADRDIPRLLSVPAVVHGVSYEPALGPVDFTPWLASAGDPGPVLKWIIVGGESGPNAREFHIEWAESVIDQTDLTSCAVFVKQLGDHVFWRGNCVDNTGAFTGKADDPSEWPESIIFREFPDEVLL